ncbi:hypothetical protein L2E82_17357 [Cichorium intybus]|uniref:Uncharacterized protein n=1 Tax=Cichorium intybus TaxID=13427 RepID=A0ACB9F8P5_CICIN|nr:hypothetical protein L2E82_17357 [Cichorium intybus]
MSSVPANASRTCTSLCIENPKPLSVTPPPSLHELLSTSILCRHQEPPMSSPPSSSFWRVQRLFSFYSPHPMVSLKSITGILKERDGIVSARVLVIAGLNSTAISGYLLFGNDTESDVLTNFDKPLGEEFRFEKNTKGLFTILGSEKAGVGAVGEQKASSNGTSLL